jgi:hypothetical protein
MTRIQVRNLCNNYNSLMNHLCKPERAIPCFKTKTISFTPTNRKCFHLALSYMKSYIKRFNS